MTESRAMTPAGRGQVPGGGTNGEESLQMKEGKEGWRNSLSYTLLGDVGGTLLTKEGLERGGA